MLRPGSLGDALLFTGALRALRVQYPQHRIVLVSSKRAAPIFARCPHVDELLLIDDNLGNPGLSARMRRTIFACRTLGRQYCKALNAVTWASIGEKADAVAGWWTAFIDQIEAEEIVELARDDMLGRDVHELDLLVKLLQAADCENVQSRKDIWPEVYLREDERAWAFALESAKETARCRPQTIDRGSCNHPLADSLEGTESTEGEGRSVGVWEYGGMGVCERRDKDFVHELHESGVAVLCRDKLSRMEIY